MAKTIVKNYVFNPGIGLLDNNNPNAYDLFLQNKDFILSEIIYFINQEINDSVKCQRDIAYIIEGCFYDVGFSCNYNARFLGFAELNSNDLSNTVKRVIEKTKNEILKLSDVTSSTQVITAVNSYFTELLNIINNGESSATLLSLPSPTNAPANNKNTKDRLLNNVDFLVSEVNAYLNLNYPNADHDVDKCTRDITYIIHALAYDIIFGGNSATWLQGKIFYYYKDPTGVGITTDHLTVTIAAYTYFKSLLEDIITGVAITPSDGNTATQDLSGSNGSQSESSYLETLVQFTINVISATTSAAADAILEGLALIKPELGFWATGDLLTGATAIQDNATDLKLNSVVLDDYTYNTEKCQRDVNYILDGYLYDLRYGGNEKTYNNIKYYWDNGVAQVDGNRVPEFLTHLYIKDLLNDYIFTNTVFPKLGPVSQFVDASKNAEAAAFTIIDQLTDATANVIDKGIEYQLTLAQSGVSSLRFIGNYDLHNILMVTNVTKNEIIYNFSDVNLGGKITKYKKLTYHDSNFPTFLQTSDSVNVLELNYATTDHTIDDDIQIFVEEIENNKSVVTTRPYDFGTDAIERARSSQPLSMIDADFEYGLQPTKWASISTLRGYPSIYEIPGTDLALASIITDGSAGTDGVGQSLITVTTVSSHNITAGTAITVKGLQDSVAGSARAEGSFITVSVPTNKTFTYYAKAKVGTGTDNLLTTYSQVRIGGFYTGANIGNPTFNVISQGSSAITVMELDVPIGSNIFPYDGQSPELGSPVNTDSTTAFPVGAQVTTVIDISSGGGTYITKDLVGDYTAGATYIDVVDATGLLDDLALDRGDGQATFIESIAGTRVFLTDALTDPLFGVQSSYSNITGSNVASNGAGATFDVSATGNVYNVVINTAGSNYTQGDRLIIDGSAIGGITNTNDLNITINTVDGNGGVLTFTETGVAFDGTATLDNIGVSVADNNGTGNEFDVAWLNNNYTVTLSSGHNTLGYVVGDKIKIAYTQLVDATQGDVTNDIVLNVDTVDVNGEILTISIDSGVGPDAVKQFVNPIFTTASTGSVTFLDIRQNGAVYSIFQINSSGFSAAETISIVGTELNGASPANDLLITVNTVDQNGEILTYTLSGSANNAGSAADIVGNNLKGTGSLISVNLSAGSYTSLIIQNGGTNYAIGQQITIDGSLLLGQTSTNDLVLEVSTIDSNYAVTAFTIISGVAATTIGNYTVSGNNIVPVGINASFNIDRDAGTYSSVTINLPGDFYTTGDKIKILGSALGGVSPANDLLITVNTVSNGQIQTISSTYTSAALGNDIPFICTYTTSESNIEFISQGQTIPFDAIATIGITFPSPHGLLPGSSFIVAIDSDNGINNHNLGAGSFVITQMPDLYNLSYQARSEGFIDLDYQPVNTPETQYDGVDYYWKTGTIVINAASGNYIELKWNGITVLNINNIENPTEYSQVTASNPDRYTVSADLWYEPGTQISTSPTENLYEITRTDVIQTAFDPVVGYVYPKPDSFFVHRPHDGGVMLGTGGPQHGAQAIRQSKKYIRYQSGKGIMYTTGALFAPSYDLRSLESDGIEVGSNITITTDDTDHGVQEGGVIRLSGIKTSGYNSGPYTAVPPEFDYTVTEVINERTFKVKSQRRLGSTTAALDFGAQMSVVSWHGATVRTGVFDDQNGIFWEYDGTQISVVLRYATTQLTGTVSANTDSNLLTGTNTRFKDQLKAGDRIVLRGMTHVVTNVFSNTQCYVAPDWRGVSNISGAKITLVVDKKIKQNEFNLDKLDGTGQSGYEIDIAKMQMIGIQYSWYGAGFIDFMLRGSNGNFIFAHRIRNSNINTEAFMRSGNLPVRYEVTNEGPSGKLYQDLSSTATSLKLYDSSFFPDEGTLYIDNEVIRFTGNDKTTNSLLNLVRSSSLSNYQAGALRSYFAGNAASHLADTGVILISQTITPLISHWGSAMLTDGGFDFDRGYIFSYTSSSINVSTTTKTAFLIRLAPSVSNAIIGDLGERELLNRAQLLLQSIEIALDTGTGAVVVEGILNPINYPANPNSISWSSLSGAAQGGQPSFTQIASAGGINWGPSTSTTTTITIENDIDSGYGLFTGTQTERYSPLTLNPTAVATYGIEVGSEIWSQNPDAFTDSGEVFYVTSVDQPNGDIYYISSNNRTRSQTNTFVTTDFKFIFRAYTGLTNRVLVAKSNFDASNAVIGTSVAASDTNWPANTAISNIIPRKIGTVEFYEVVFNQTSVATLNAGNTVTFEFANPAYASPGETIFSFIANPGSFNTLNLGELKELTNTPLGGRGTFPNGPDVLAINVYKVSGAAINANIILRWGEAQA